MAHLDAIEREARTRISDAQHSLTLLRAVRKMRGLPLSVWIALGMLTVAAAVTAVALKHEIETRRATVDLPWSR